MYGILIFNATIFCGTQLISLIVHLRLTFSYIFLKILVVRELTLGFKILDFFMEFEDLSGSNFELTRSTISLSYFDIAMLLDAKKVKLVFGQLKNTFLT